MCVNLQVAWLCWQYTLTFEAKITLGHMPVPEYKSFLISLKVLLSRLAVKVNLRHGSASILLSNLTALPIGYIEFISFMFILMFTVQCDSHLHL